MTGGDVRVEIDVFSGRPNPSWALSPAEAGDLAARLRDLPREGRPRPRLGYRGFVVHRPDPRGGSWPWLHVGGGAVEVFAGAGRGCYRDVAGIEEWLVALADREGFGALLGSAGAVEGD